MTEVVGNTERMAQWVDAFAGTPDWDTLYEGFEATVDWPGSYYYRELIEAYPDAKVLLSVRDGVTWARSMRDTIWDMTFGDSLVHHLVMAQAQIDPVRREFARFQVALAETSGLFGPDPRVFDETALLAAMERHNAEVRRIVPEERLLEWRPTDGWGPLCEFLEVPVPAGPLPSVNDSGSFGGMVIARNLEVLNQWHAAQPAPTAPSWAALIRESAGAVDGVEKLA
jgi:hypothetical protein